MNLPYCVEDLATVFSKVEGRPFPIDGIIWPKAEHPEELQWVDEILGGIESKLGLPAHSIKMQFLVEGGWALLQLPDLVKPVMPRLAGIIFGIADYSADIGLPAIVNDHPVCDLARGIIVNMAGAIGVPAIDNMTVNYPVAEKSLDAAGNKRHILQRLKECFDDARHGFNLGMDGKWVGHPAQLFACLLAYRSALPQKDIDAEVAKIEAYVKAVAAEQGATIIEGVMSDRATDRHARMRLRKAVAYGRLDAKKALALGIVTQDEADQVTG
jgi:citrate lyase beta subunit